METADYGTMTRVLQESRKEARAEVVLRIARTRRDIAIRTAHHKGYSTATIAAATDLGIRQVQKIVVRP